MDLVLGFRQDEIKGIKITRDNLQVIQKAETSIENLFLENEWKFLNLMWNTHRAPKLISFEGGKLVTVDLGETEEVTDEIIFRRECAKLLWELKNRGIRHGDLTTKNIIIKKNAPVVLDWKQSKFAGDKTPDKRPEGDAYHLWRSAEELSPDTSRHLRRWIAIRDHLIGKSVVDLGCAEGDFCLFSEADGLKREVVGYDREGQYIEYAELLWGKYGMRFIHADITKTILEHADVALLMSTWAYLIQDYGKTPAMNFLTKVKSRYKELIFETQLSGDGPGPEFLQTDEDVWKMLSEFGKVEHLAQIPVEGRNAARSVWRVT